MAERIGDILVQIGAMTQDQVDQVLQAQRAGDGRLFGEIAIERGYLEESALARYVDFTEKQQDEPDACP